jgi:hypothetical protein
MVWRNLKFKGELDLRNLNFKGELDLRKLKFKGEWFGVT